MYCKKCGQKIEDDSRFCQHCGALQKQPNLSLNSNQVFAPQIVDKIEGIFGINLSKKVVGIYLIWFLLHLILLLVNWNGNSSAGERLWPFSKHSNLDDYDFTEFLLYTIVPLIFLVIINLFRERKGIEFPNMQSKYDLDYEIDPLPRTFGIFTLVCYALLYLLISISPKASFDPHSAQQLTIFLSVISLIMRVLITIWVVHIAKKINRDTLGWGLFAFFLPLIALIFVGFKKKLRSPL